MTYVFATILTLLNLVFWVTIVFGLPGTWLMILGAALTDWWLAEEPLFGGIVLLSCLALAVLGEILEFMLSATGSRGAGGSRRAAALAIIGGIVGAIIGTPFPVPLLGTLIGACIGAFAGSLIGDLWAGRPVFRSVEAGKGAAVGRLWGTVSKMAVGAVIVLVLGVGAWT